jgi:prolyl-tRNA editing enzyme YbaK/EbsC (Cys-tRNA(Pro) deacylase)
VVEQKRSGSRLSSNAQRVEDALRDLGFRHEVVEFPSATRTAAEAAQAVGCQVGQIAKSLVFRGQNTQRPILVIASGSNRVNEQRMAEYVGEPLAKADADFVRHHTGFIIGGVPPLGHLERMEIFIDEDLMAHGEIWAAAGTPHAVFRLIPSDLARMTGGRVVTIK